MHMKGWGGRAEVCTPAWNRSLSVLLAAWALLVTACTKAPPEARTQWISIRAFQYVPASDTVAAGDTVVWINEDAVPHTATAADQAWDTGSIETKESALVVVTKKGDYAYLCAFHPNMSGTLIVQ
jgi:plastocyanin